MRTRGARQDFELARQGRLLLYTMLPSHKDRLLTFFNYTLFIRSIVARLSTRSGNTLDNNSRIIRTRICQYQWSKIRADNRADKNRRQDDHPLKREIRFLWWWLLSFTVEIYNFNLKINFIVKRDSRNCVDKFRQLIFKHWYNID